MCGRHELKNKLSKIKATRKERVKQSDIQVKTLEWGGQKQSVFFFLKVLFFSFLSILCFFSNSFMNLCEGAHVLRDCESRTLEQSTTHDATSNPLLSLLSCYFLSRKNLFRHSIFYCVFVLLFFHLNIDRTTLPITFI